MCVWAFGLRNVDVSLEEELAQSVDLLNEGLASSGGTLRVLTAVYKTP